MTPTTEEIRSVYSDRYEYFCLCRQVSRDAGTDAEAAACAYLRRVMLALGYPAVAGTWTDEKTIMYAQNIISMG